MKRLAGRFAIGALALAVAAMGAAGTGSFADEGMWTYDQLPKKELQERYGFAPTTEWLDHLRLSSVRIGASGSFVAPDGLILTNHHVALGSLQRLATPENNYVRDGFYAKTRAGELPIPGLAVEVLQSIEDVTDRIDRAVKPGASAAESKLAHDAASALAADECNRTTKLKCTVVTLYGAAKHYLYRYKEYSDVRLVFAPEIQAAFFGGDADNFTYPRHELDFAFFRAWEDGRPARVPHYLKVNPAGASAGDLVFVSGHPRTTGRLETYNMLMYRREVTHPASIARQKAMRELLGAFSARGPEQARRARTRLYFVENSLKALEGEYEGLKDPALMERKRAEEEALIAKLEANPALSASRRAWSELDGAIAWARAHEKERLWRRSLGARGLLSAAIDIVRYAQEAPKPDADRLEGFHEAELADLLRGLRNPGPTYKDLEEVLLAHELKSMAQGLGSGDPFVRAVLAGATPEALAARAVEGTRLDDKEVRRQLLENGGRGVAASRDPLIELARRVEPGLRETQNQFRDHVEAVEEKGLSEIAEARFAVNGTDSYPDASGTLRFSFGRLSGYPFATTLVPPFTTFFGLLDRSIALGNTGDFALPAGIATHQRELALPTPLNFVSTNDITGGNSGSPVVDRGGRLVGLVFDGNMQSHPNKFVYDEVAARSVSVDVRAILETLRKVYGAPALANELESAAK